MKVTVAMPAFNAAEFIGEAIDSILDQDFDSFELVLVDDGSTDATWKIMKKYAKHSKVRTYRNPHNLGAGATRNLLTRLAHGEYITPCDADDLLLPGVLRKFSHYLDNHPRVGAVYGDV